MTVPLRAALYLRVSTARQAEHDISIPDHRRQGEAYCTARGYQLVETYVEPGSTATNLLRTLAAASGVKSAALGVRSSVPRWRPQGDSNPCYRRERAMS